jgi:coenzyme F420-0:L-glutamate ligase / coenzyme F420-1:gamma-L-glutamate ligase
MPTNADELHAFLRTRRSIRRFKPDPIADEVIARILATASHAPSAHNLQPWRFVVIKNNQSAELNEQSAPSAKSADNKKNLAQALTSSLRADMISAGAPASEIEKRIATSIRRIHEAPVIVLLCRDRTAVRADTPEEHTMSIQSAAAAGTVLLLAAHAEGLGANWICWPLYAKEETRDALELPETREPQAMYFIGYADEEPKEKIIRPLDEILLLRR